MNHHHSSRRALAVLMLAALTLASAGAANLPLPTAEATSSITARDLKRHLSFLASSELGGRYTFSQSNLIAARYLASQLESYGYHGAARDRSFFQRVPLSYRNVDLAASRLTLSDGAAKREFIYADSFVAEVPANMNVSSELVFVGYGVSSPRNSYDDYAGLTVKGRIVVMSSGLPEPLKNVRLNVDEQAATAALAHGAIGLIKILDAQTLLTWEQLKVWFGGRQQLGLPPRTTASGKVLPEVTAGPELIKAIAKAMGKESSELIAPGSKLKPSELTASAEIKLRVEAKDAPSAQNVVGILEGGDSKLKDEYVVFSAHYDHLKTSDKGEVYHGADDDGSGTVSVLEIAQAFAMGPRPKRSILIVFHTGEELGLYGSEFNTDYEPVVPLQKLVANLNIDMVGRSRPEGDDDPRDARLTDKNSIYIIGADKLSTELNKLNEETNQDTARLRFDYTYNDEKHPERFYYRSDHYNYAKHGIPIVFFFTGLHRDYHQPSDVVEKIDFEKMERIDRLIFATGWRVANLDHRLVVDKRP
ncbi:MAG: M28 family peptidase [Acidobacteriota bacterium]